MTGSRTYPVTIVRELDVGTLAVLSDEEADSGEDDIAYCPDSDYAANVELAEALAPGGERPAPAAPLAKVATPARR